MKDDTKNPEASTAGEVRKPRKPYEPPKLIERGAVESVTGALGSGTKDGLSGSLLL